MSKLSNSLNYESSSGLEFNLVAALPKLTSPECVNIQNCNSVSSNWVCERTRGTFRRENWISVTWNAVKKHELLRWFWSTHFLLSVKFINFYIHHIEGKSYFQFSLNPQDDSGCQLQLRSWAHNYFPMNNGEKEYEFSIFSLQSAVDTPSIEWRLLFQSWCF